MKNYNRELFNKLTKELQLFRSAMLEKTPEEVFNRAHEICIKKECVAAFSFEENTIDENEAAVLCEVDNLLDYFYEGYQMTDEENISLILKQLAKENAGKKEIAEYFK